MTDLTELVRMLFKRAGGIAIEAGHDCMTCYSASLCDEPDGVVGPGLLGSRCYITAFKISSLGCFVAFLLSILAGVKRERMNRERKRIM